MSHYMKASKKSFSRNAQEFIIRPLLRQRETGELCDLTIKLNGRCFNAHKAVLALWSPYFLSMFTCDMRERLTRELDLSESLILERDDVFGTVLDYMYTGSITLTIENVEDIVKISDFLLIDDVKEYCRQFYLDLGNLDLTNCIRLKFLAEDHNMPEVAKFAQKMIESRFHDYVIYHDEMLDLLPSCIFRLLEDSRVVQHTSYNELKRVVQRWIDFDRSFRQQYQSDLMTCVKSWISDYANEASYLGREMSTSDILRRSMEGSLTSASASAGPSDADTDFTDKRDTESPSDCGSQVLLAVVCNQGLKFMKILIYSLQDQKWYQFPVSGEKMLHYMPVRQTVCNMVLNDNKLFMYLCSSFPYPTDMMKINILVTDLVTGQPTLFSFRTVDFYNPCYRTTLTNIRTAPPVMVSCNNQLFVLGNKEGTGHLFMCNLATHQYTCFQIPGSRFISLGRATVKDDRHIYMWFRHRTGPSEEFCIKKSIGFAVFDTRTKIFSSWELPPPDISYDDFSKPYVMCVREDTVFIYHPGQPALVLDEVRSKWVTSIRRISTPHPDFSVDTQAYGFQLLVSTSESVFILNNECPYTTSLHEVSEKFPCSMAHIPPPIDHISVVAVGSVPKTMMQSLDKCSRYDDAYSSALHVAMQYSDGDSDDSAASNYEEQDSENDYEYDEDIYDYDYDVEIGLDF
ncbi:uncharacterized protein LOC124270948 [Haliotis rubra]|uniref:uncharacterized protein LOC124270948 n=1 Tax=Haliotis rubra TaxID=36100 RepID=UPI001EE5C5EA|nr:uncharacterized protein LOC124270948 [Haliotis rubra]